MNPLATSKCIRMFGLNRLDRYREASHPLFIEDGWMKRSVSFSANSYGSNVTTVKNSLRSSHSLLFEFTPFFTMSCQCQYSDLEAEHKQNWMWPWATILSLKLRLAQCWSPVHLRRLAKFSSFVSLYHFILTHALMTSQRDSCNGPEVGLSQTLSLPTAAGPVSDSTSFSPYQKQEQISLPLASLHWLYFGLWTDLKMILFIFECQSSWQVCSIITPPLGTQSSRSIFRTFWCKFFI